MISIALKTAGSLIIFATEISIRIVSLQQIGIDAIDLKYKPD